MPHDPATLPAASRATLAHLTIRARTALLVPAEETVDGWRVSLLFDGVLWRLDLAPDPSALDQGDGAAQRAALLRLLTAFPSVRPPTPEEDCPSLRAFWREDGQAILFSSPAGERLGGPPTVMAHAPLGPLPEGWTQRPDPAAPPQNGGVLYRREDGLEVAVSDGVQRPGERPVRYLRMTRGEGLPTGRDVHLVRQLFLWPTVPTPTELERPAGVRHFMQMLAGGEEPRIQPVRAPVTLVPASVLGARRPPGRPS